MRGVSKRVVGGGVPSPGVLNLGGVPLLGGVPTTAAEAGDPATGEPSRYVAMSRMEVGTGELSLRCEDGPGMF